VYYLIDQSARNWLNLSIDGFDAQIDYAFDDVDCWHEWPFPDRGPFLFRMMNTQKVYRLLITRDGQEEIAYVRVGHWALGLLYPVVSMRWKSEPSQKSKSATPSVR